MYNYDFKKNDEQVIYENKEAIVDFNENTFNLSVLVTNKNLLFFKNSGMLALQGREMALPDDFLLLLSISLDTIKYKIELNDTIINYDNNKIIIYEFDLAKILGR